MDWTSCLKQAPGAPTADIQTIKCLEPLIANTINAVTLFAGIALFVFLTIGGFKYLTAGGDPKKAEEAKSTITMTLVGFVLIIGSYLVLRILATFFGDTIGADLLKINVEFPGFE